MEGNMLKSVLAEFRRTGLEEASFSGVRPHKKYPVVPLSRPILSFSQTLIVYWIVCLPTDTIFFVARFMTQYDASSAFNKIISIPTYPIFQDMKPEP